MRGPTLFARGGVPWVPLPVSLLNERSCARMAWVTLMLLRGQGEGEGPEIDVSDELLLSVAPRRDSTLRKGLKILAGLGLIERRRGTGKRRRKVVVLVRLEPLGKAEGGRP